MSILSSKQAEVHMETGPIGRTLVLFTLPVLLSQLLQQMYSIVDCMIVGHFGGENALAAAGEASLLLSVMINFFVGFSVGAGALVAQYFGAYRYDRLKRLLNMSMLVSGVLGIVLLIVGVAGAELFLRWINCPEEVLQPAAFYLKICMCGVIPQLIYNMGNAQLRALGNTKEPLYFLSASALLNIVLDLLFVVGFRTGLAGAGAATVLVQWVLAALILRKMTRLDEEYRVGLSGLGAGREQILPMLQNGLPSGMQAVFMSISSLVIQYSINAFGADAAAGMVVYARVEGFVYYPAFAYGMALTGFVGQNFGAKRMDRVAESMWKSLLMLGGFTLTLSGAMTALAPWILKLFTSDTGIAASGLSAIRCILPFYFLYAVDQVYLGGLKGLGENTYPMLCSLLCYCVFRVVWCSVLLVFLWDIRVIYASYTVSLLLMLFLLLHWYRRTVRRVSHQLHSTTRKIPAG